MPTVTVDVDEAVLSGDPPYVVSSIWDWLGGVAGLTGGEVAAITGITSIQMTVTVSDLDLDEGCFAIAGFGASEDDETYMDVDWAMSGGGPVALEFSFGGQPIYAAGATGDPMSPTVVGVDPETFTVTITGLPTGVTPLGFFATPTTVTDAFGECSESSATLTVDTVSVSYSTDVSGAPCVTPWNPSDEEGFGTLTFSDVGDFQIPNYAFRFVDAAASELQVAQLVGKDIEVIDGLIATPRWEFGRSARLYLQMSYLFDPDGTPYDSAAEGWYENWEILNLLYAPSTTGSGLQEVVWVPYDGATPIELDVHVLPPIPGSATVGEGMMVTLPIEVPDP